MCLLRCPSDKPTLRAVQSSSRQQVDLRRFTADDGIGCSSSTTTLSDAVNQRRRTGAARGDRRRDPSGVPGLLRPLRQIRISAAIEKDRGRSPVGSTSGPAKGLVHSNQSSGTGASLRMEQGLWVGGDSGAHRPGIQGARCGAGLRQDDGRQHRLAAVMEKAGMGQVRIFHADWPVHIPGDEHGDVEYAITRAEWSPSPESNWQPQDG